MRKSIFCGFSVIVFGISACMNHDTMTTMLDITYPAAYVVNGQGNDIDIINLNDNTHADHISLNGATYPHHIYLSPDKSKLAVAITSTDLSGGHAGHAGTTTGLRVQIIDAKTGMIDKEISLSKMPHNAIFNPSGTELWVGQMDTIQSHVLVYKTSDWSLQNTINVGKGLSEVTFSADGTMVYACNTMDGTVSVIDPASKILHATIAVGQNPVGAWAASNGKMYVDNEMSQTISEISVSGMNVTQTINLGYTPAYVAYHSSSQELWVSDATNGKVHYYKYDTGMSMWMQQGEFVTGANAHAIAFASNGKAYITNQDANTVSVVDIATHTITNTINVGTKPNGLTIKQ